jgi:hypothetical protein
MRKTSDGKKRTNVGPVRTTLPSGDFSMLIAYAEGALQSPTFTCSFCLKRPDGSYRLCEDCQRLNNYENGDNYSDYFSDIMNRDD